MLLEQIKGFCHGITNWLVVIPCLIGICKDVYVVVQLWDLDYITSKQHTKLYAQGLADYAQKYSCSYYASLAAPAPSLTL